MAKLIYPNGKLEDVQPNNGNVFTLEEIQGFVGGYIEIVKLHDNALFVMNEDGKRENLSPNIPATSLAHGRQAIRPDDIIVGTVLLCTPAEIGD